MMEFYFNDNSITQNKTKIHTKNYLWSFLDNKIGLDLGRTFHITNAVNKIRQITRRTTNSICNVDKISNNLLYHMLYVLHRFDDILPMLVQR